jgi:small subunit ribosomal protein S11
MLLNLCEKVLFGVSMTAKAVSQAARRKRKEKRYVALGIAHVYASFNNTHVTVTDVNGNVIAAASAGRHGFKGSRKSTPYAAQITGENVGKAAMEWGMKTVSVVIRGPGTGRESAVRGLHSAGLVVTAITDATPVPHNGCRPRKKRRV